MSRTRILMFLTLGLGLAVMGSTVAATSAEATAEAEILRGIVVKISDGDTIHLKEGRTTHKIRMVGMDTPELHLGVPGGVKSQGWWAEEATKFLAKKIPLGTRVRLKVFGYDTYGRVLGRVLHNNRDINLALVEAGWAAPYALCSGDDCTASFMDRHDVEEYARACEEARAAGKGIFNKRDPLPEMPFEFRLRVMKRQPDKYVGDIRNRELKHPDEYKKIDLCNRIFFYSVEEAEKLGYSLN